MDEQRQDDKLEPIYNSSVPIQDVALKTSLEQWTIETGDKRRSGRSLLAAWHDDEWFIIGTNSLVNIIFFENVYKRISVDSKSCLHEMNESFFVTSVVTRIILLCCQFLQEHNQYGKRKCLFSWLIDGLVLMAC